jgi:hypothetical protein
VSVTSAERPGTLPVSAHRAVEAARAQEADHAEVVVEEVQEAAAATTVVSQVTCHVTAPSRAWAVVVVVVAVAVAATAPATTVVRVDISPVSALTRWEVAVAVDLAVIVPQTDASVTTVTRLDTCLVTALMPTGGHQTGAALSASGAMRWVTLLVTVLTAAAAAVDLVDHVVVVAVVAAAQTCVATTAMRSDTSRATVPPSRSATPRLTVAALARRRPVTAETYSTASQHMTGHLPLPRAIAS